MPKVPTIENRARLTGISAPQARANVPIEAFGGGSANRVGEALAGLGRAVEDYQLKERDKADRARLWDAEYQRQQFELELEKQGYSRKQRNAINVEAELADNYNKKIKEIEDGLSNDNQKEMFRQKAQNGLLGFRHKMARHELGERNKYDNELINAAVTNYRQSGIENFHDPALVFESIKNQKDAIADYAERNGESAATLKLKMQEVENSTHAGVISRMIDSNQDLRAKGYFEAIKENLDGTTAGKLQKLIDEGSFRGEAQRSTDSLIEKFGDGAEALARARDIKDPKLRDEVVGRIKQRNSENQLMERQLREDTFDEGMSILANNGYDYDLLPQEKLAVLTQKERDALKEYGRKKRQGQDVKTNWDLYYKLYDEPKTLANIRLNEYKHQLGDAEFKELVKLQQKSRRGGGSDLSELEQIETKNQILKSYMPLAGVVTDKNATKEDREKEIKFRRFAQDELQRKQTELGRELTNNEFRETLDKLTLEVVTDEGFIWDTKKPLFDVSMEDVPSKEREKIIEALTKRNISPTEDNIVTLYRQRLKNGT